MSDTVVRVHLPAIREVFNERELQSYWRKLAACRGMDPEIFFPGRGDTGGLAKAVCEGCPVKAPCERYAVETNPPWGIWAGRGERERRRLRRERREQVA